MLAIARVEMRRDDLAVQVVVVVDGRDRDVDLRRPIRRVASVGAPDELEPLDEIPPTCVVSAVGVRVQARVRSAS